MTLSWMLYAVVIGTLLALAAASLDRVAGALAWPRRFIWLGAMATALLWPVATAGRALLPRAAPPIPGFTYVLPPLRVVAGADARVFSITLEDTLVIAWALVSIILIARLVGDLITLRRLRRRWPLGEIDGCSVRLTADVGPAVVGLRRLELVVPDWILSLDEPLRSLVISHEEEHREARDPQVLLAARVATVLMPWNPAVWYAARRLRLAIELDCDARVLRTHPWPQRYGMLLLTIAQRQSTLPTALAPSLSRSASRLERRILALRSSAHNYGRRTAVIGALVAAAALALACSVQSGTSPSSRSANAATPQFHSTNSAYFEFQVEKPVSPVPGMAAPRYPDALRKANGEGEVIALFVVDTTGRIDMSTFEPLKSSDERFTNSVRSALAAMKFNPAEIGGRKVKQVVQMPFVFSLSRR